MAWASRQYLKDMTHGKRPKEIIAWLKAEGIKFRIGIDGWPSVLMSHAEQIFGGAATRPTPDVRLDHLKGNNRGTSKEITARPA